MSKKDVLKEGWPVIESMIADDFKLIQYDWASEEELKAFRKLTDRAKECTKQLCDAVWRRKDGTYLAKYKTQVLAMRFIEIGNDILGFLEKEEKE